MPRCGACNGKGYVIKVDATNCYSCSGYGNTPENKDCTACKTTGKVFSPCTSCSA
ncbi:hypothetical protein WAI453_000789 [Rhynchosporium graminicola]